MTRQFQIQEKDVQRSQQQLQNAISMATDEAVKSRAAKEVIKSLTAQVSHRSAATLFQLSAASCSGLLDLDLLFVYGSSFKQHPVKSQVNKEQGTLNMFVYYAKKVMLQSWLGMWAVFDLLLLFPH
jgi:hypothetical protein